MGRRLLFILGLGSAALGGWLLHHEGVLNARCNDDVAHSTQSTSTTSQCIDIIWPYAEGFLFLVLGALLVFSAMLLTRRVMSGERQYMKDVKAGKYSRENDHLNAYNFNTKKPTLTLRGEAHGGLFDGDDDEYS